MRWFYEADVREPLFPALTRLMLAPTGGRILSVHVASAVGSTLLVLATYLLGAAAFSRVTGLLAALLFAVERDALWWSVEGFRDDTFALFVVLGAWALVRLWQSPTTARAVARRRAARRRLPHAHHGALVRRARAAVARSTGRGEDARERRRSVAIAAARAAGSWSARSCSPARSRTATRSTR